MGRYTGEIDQVLVSEVMKRYGLKTKREAVDFALKTADANGQLRQAIARGRKRPSRHPGDATQR